MNLDRVTTLLSSGLKPAQVATIIGVSPARISQLMSQEDFQTMLSGKLAEQKEVDVEEQSISAKYNAAEHLLLNNIMEVAPTAELRDMVGALRVVAERQEKMKTRTSVQAPILHQQLTVVSVNLPAHALAVPRVQFNSAREVVAIEDRPLAPMTANAVTDMFKKMNNPPTAVGIIEGDSHEPVSSNPSPEESLAQAVPSAPLAEVEEQSFLAYAGR